MNSKRRTQQFVRFRIRGLMAFFVAAVMIVSVIGLGILLWYELTDPERLEPQRAQLPRIYCLSETDPIQGISETLPYFRASATALSCQRSWCEPLIRMGIIF